MNTFLHLALRSKFGLAVAAGAWVVLFLADAPALAGEEQETLEVVGTVRDFRERTEPDGHPDFEKRPDHGFARYVANISPMLGEDQKPVFTGGGYKIASQWYDAEHRPICRLLYDPELGDTAGNYAQQDNGGITSAESFDLWYRDQMGVNLSKPLAITLVRQPDGRYVFDDRLDPLYADMGGFFPIDDDLFGNSPGIPDHNYHFTYELHMECEYDSTANQFFMFIGDDDVWVFVNGQLVIDLGGVHAALDQYVDMNRLGLTDGETYQIDFFFAERFRTQSNFRIETNIPVRTAGLPSATAAFD
jgi:fibro-slime domain-containing protein